MTSVIILASVVLCVIVFYVVVKIVAIQEERRIKNMTEDEFRKYQNDMRKKQAWSNS